MTNQKNTAIETETISLHSENNRIGFYVKSVEFLQSYLDHTMNRGVGCERERRSNH
jgi:hypothetical protein